MGAGYVRCGSQPNTPHPCRVVLSSHPLQSRAPCPVTENESEQCRICVQNLATLRTRCCAQAALCGSCAAKTALLKCECPFCRSLLAVEPCKPHEWSQLHDAARQQGGHHDHDDRVAHRLWRHLGGVLATTRCSSLMVLCTVLACRRLLSRMNHHALCERK